MSSVMSPEIFFLSALFIAPLPVMIWTGGWNYGDDMTNYPGWQQESNVIPIDGKHRAWQDHMDTALNLPTITEQIMYDALLPGSFDELLLPQPPRYKRRPTNWTVILSTGLLCYIAGFVVGNL